MIERESFVVIGVGCEGHPLRNSPFDRPHHFCFSLKSDDLQIDLAISIFVSRTDDFTSGKFTVASVAFDGRGEVLGTTPDMGIPKTRYFSSDTSV